MNDQLLSDLRAAGFDARPTATLDKEGTFFALTEDQLIYLDAGGAASVSLRDVTRIHSDQAGILRVETGAVTAVTAPLLGYDPGRVQHFFAEVRQATARAKSLPPSPTPGESSSPWKTGWGGSNTPAPSVTVIRPSGADHAAPQTAHAVDTFQPEAPPPELAQAEPAQAAPTFEPAPPEPEPSTQEPEEEPKEDSEAGPTDLSSPEPNSPEPVAPERSSPEPAMSDAAAPEPVRISSTPAAPRPAEERRPAPASALIRETPITPLREVSPSPLGRFAPTLRFLAILMGLTGVGVGALEWRAGAQLSGLWLVGVGAVGAFALYVFAEVVRAVADIQARVSGGDR